MPLQSGILPRLAWLAIAIVLGTVVAMAVHSFREASAESLRSAGERQAVKAVQEQEACWNKGDLEGFMAHYWKSDDLLFYSGGDVTKGWQATYDRYHKRYKAGGKEMGSLTFTLETPESQGPDSVILRGQWSLKLSTGNPHGLFTLLFKRIQGEWKIVSDHTSVAEEKK